MIREKQILTRKNLALEYVFLCLFHPSGNSVAAQARKREDEKKIPTYSKNWLQTMKSLWMLRNLKRSSTYCAYLNFKLI